MSETQQPLPTTPDAQEIDDQSLEQVVGGAIGNNSLIIDSTEEGLKKQTTKTASFGGEEWGRK